MSMPVKKPPGQKPTRVKSFMNPNPSREFVSYCAFNGRERIVLVAVTIWAEVYFSTLYLCLFKT